jgi:hypothetical protein
MPLLPSGEIDATSMESFQIARPAYTVDYDLFLERFGSRRPAFRKFLISQMLRRTDVDERELRYFAIWRRHILRVDRRHFTFSPEVSMFSANVGLHYSLLKNATTGEPYQAKRAAHFQYRVEAMLSSLNVKVLARNYWVNQGKTDLGDVDLLAESAEYYFNIECKGTMLPLAVYFHDFDYIRDVHLPYLRDKKGWGKKVSAREEWIKANRGSLGLESEKPILSVIISENPEILSHYSDTVCLSFNEFPLWLQDVREHGRPVTFEEFQGEILRPLMGPSSDGIGDAAADYLGLRYEKNASEQASD